MNVALDNDQNQEILESLVSLMYTPHFQPVLFGKHIVSAMISSSCFEGTKIWEIAKNQPV